MPSVKSISTTTKDEELPIRKVKHQQEQEPFNFEYNNRTFESYQKHNLPIPNHLKEQDQEAIFLSIVDPQNMQNIERKITKIVRLKKPDLLAKGKHSIKEYLVIFENWYGKDWRGEDVAPVTDHIEGIYMEQDVKPAPFVNGRPTGEYKRTGQHEVWFLEYSKEALDERLNASVSDKDEIIYHIEIGSADRRAPKYAKTFSYEQFSTLSFDELLKLTV